MRVPGFRFGGVAAGLKASGALDLGLIVADAPVEVAATFTRSQAAAAPVHLSRARAKGGRCRAVLVNSGNANACTGRRGERDARAMTARLARELGVRDEEVLVASTGVIGAPLPMDAIIEGIPRLVAAASETGTDDFARAILTTDAGPKTAEAAGRVGGKRARVAGFAKGAGMIMPDMATMLAFVCTDATSGVRDLRRITRAAVNDTFNAITVDGDTSTNDAVFVLASGRARGGADPEGLERLVRRVMAPLARSIVADGEGATHVVAVTVRGAGSLREADRVARRIANSPLVKTAFHGRDPNWGRVVGAASTAGVKVDPEAMDLRVGGVLVYGRGKWKGADAERRARERMASGGYEVVLDLRQGTESRTVLTCDLTAEYVRINAGYRS